MGAVLSRPDGSALLLVFGYAAFAAFVILSLSGALVSLHATRTRFKYPPPKNSRSGERPTITPLLCPLIRSRPRAWIKGWVTAGADGDPGDKPTIREDLQQRYLRHLVSETYLVAAKTADKLRYLEPAQSLLATSLRFLFLWILLLAPIVMFVPSTKLPAQPIKVTLVPSPPSPRPAENATPPVGNSPSTGTKGQIHDAIARSASHGFCRR